MYVTTILGIITISISLLGLLMVKIYTDQKNKTNIEIASVDMTLKQFFAKYHFDLDIDLPKMGQAIQDIDDNDFNDILGELKQDALNVIVLDKVSAQKQAYAKFLAHYQKQSKKFQRSLGVQESHGDDIRRIFMIGVSFGILLVAFQVIPSFHYYLMTPIQWVFNGAGFLSVGLMAFVLIGSLSYLLHNNI